MENQSTLIRSNAKEIVSQCMAAINNEDFENARKLVHADFKFDGVLGSREGAEAYFRDMEKMKLKYDIKKIFADSDDVCVLYNLDMSGVSVFCCGWYQVVQDKIKFLKVVFDPRPVLQSSSRR
jgi:hypothetical protein